MKIYKLSKEEIEKAHNEFNKTDFGKRAKIFSVVPVILTYIMFFAAFMIMIVNGVSDAVSNEEIFSDSDVLILAAFGLGAILLSIGCITQLQYGKMLADYVNSKSKK